MRMKLIFFSAVRDHVSQQHMIWHAGSMLRVHLLGSRLAQGVTASDQAHSGISQDEDGVWDPFSLEDLLSAGLEAHLEAVAAISATAQREWCVSARCSSKLLWACFCPECNGDGES